MLAYLGKSYLNACLTISCDCIGKNSCNKKWLTLRLDREDRLAVQVVRYTATWRGYGIRRSLTCRRCCTVWYNCPLCLFCNQFSLPYFFFLPNTCRNMSLYFTSKFACIWHRYGVTNNWLGLKLVESQNICSNYWTNSVLCLSRLLYHCPW